MSNSNLVRDVTFRFGTVSEIPELTQGQIRAGAILPKFVREEKDGKTVFRREKIEGVEIILPEFCATLPPLAVNAIEDLMAKYLKERYVQNYIPVETADQRWSVVETFYEKETKERIRNIAFPKTAREAFASVFSTALAKILSANPVLAPKSKAICDAFSSLILGGFSTARIQKIGNYDLATLAKIAGQVEKVAPILLTSGDPIDQAGIIWAISKINAHIEALSAPEEAGVFDIL